MTTSRQPAGRAAAPLVQRQRAMTQRMLEFLGLPWDARCLEFEHRAASIHNYSRWQVRQPINARSVERWRHYGKHLGPLRELLEEQG